MIIQTKRLYMRKLCKNDFNELCEILQDKDVMYAYEHAFDNKEVQEWLDNQLVGGYFERQRNIYRSVRSNRAGLQRQ